MPRVAVVTDSSAYLPTDLSADLGIAVVSLYCELEGEAREPETGGEFGSFYDRLEASGGVATSSPPTIDDFTAAYERTLAGGGEIVSVHISSGLSETCANARAAAAQPGVAGRVEVVDSASTCGDLALVALAAARGAAAGESAKQVAERARSARQEAKLWFLVETLDHLQRGGRIGTAAAWIGSTLQIKPILTVESEITAVERVRTRDRALERLIELMRQRRALGADAWWVQHTRCREEADRLEQRLREVFRRPPEFVSEIGPAIGAHVGPGVIAAGSLPSRFLAA